MASRMVKGPSPVSDSILGRLYRASPEGLAVFVKTVPPQTRAALAVYCLHRENLSSIGLAIAASAKARTPLPGRERRFGHYPEPQGAEAAGRRR